MRMAGEGTPPVSASMAAGFAWAASAVLIFSGWFVVTRFSVTHELRVWDITALRFGIGCLLLSPVLLGSRSRLPARRWLAGLPLALLWGAPFVILVAIGLRLISAAQAAAVVPGAMPLFAGLFAFILGERQGRLRWTGFAAIAGGLTLLVAGGAPEHGVPSGKGIAALLAAAAMWAVYTLTFRRSGLSPLQSAALMCFWSTVLFLPVYVGLGLSRLAAASAGEILLQAGYQGVLMSGVALFAFNRSVTLLGASAASSIPAMVPVAASITAIPILGEVPAPAEWLAILVICTGVLLVSRQSVPVTGRAVPVSAAASSERNS